MSRYPITMLLMLLMPFAPAAQEHSDPMRPDNRNITTTRSTQAKGTTATAPSQMKLWLQSIQIGAKEKNTTINGRLLQMGDTINGAQVIAIERTQVKLRRGGTEIKLQFLPQTIKR